MDSIVDRGNAGDIPPQMVIEQAEDPKAEEEQAETQQRHRQARGESQKGTEREAIVRVGRGLEDDGNRLSCSNDEVYEVGSVEEQIITDTEVHSTNRGPRKNAEKQAEIVANTATSSPRSLRQKASQWELSQATPRGQKRSRLQSHSKTAANRIETPKNRPGVAVSATPISLLINLAYIPSSSTEDVYNILARRIDEGCHDKLPLLTRLFFAIASADAFDQLSEACMLIRQKEESIMPDSLSDVSQTMKALDKLDVAVLSHIFFDAFISPAFSITAQAGKLTTKLSPPDGPASVSSIALRG